MSIVTVIVSTSESIESERRFDKGLTLLDLKCKLEPITGIPASTQKIELFRGNNLIGPLDDDERMLGSYPVDDYMRLHISDLNPHRVKNQFTDVSLVEKFELTEEEYANRHDSVRAFKERNKLGRFSKEALEDMAEFERQNDEAAMKIKVGERCEIQLTEDSSVKRRGWVRYLGTTEFQSGLWVGVQYDEPLGKNDGSVQGERYFTCPPKYGSFVRPNKVITGDFPEEDILMSDEEEDDLEEM
ncbi:CAP Gly-rich domain-containing protein [Phycomyces nitens]|nr:CAP Gly-rich domain-containing protein [Phycomyces nitens]